MTIIKSISGIRGTIGGKVGDNLTPIDVVKFTTAYAAWLRERNAGKKMQVVVGRDARISGPMVSQLIIASLSGMGIDVIDLGLATTPTTEIAVTGTNSQGGIIVTASHNPKQYNALKLLNEKGEFLDNKDGQRILDLAENLDSDSEIEYARVDELGNISQDNSWLKKHIDAVLALPYVDLEAIRNKKFSVAIDCVNSVGGLAIPELLRSLGVQQIHELYTEPNGHFPHNPEPLPENLVEISKLVRETGADLAFVVDPDVDRLAIINEDGSMFGEEYTLVSVADYLLGFKAGNTVSNLSSTRALRDVSEKHSGSYTASAVGEVNVVTAMKETNAVIGGEGNGGVILPDLHYGRDALVGIAMFLSHLAKSGLKCSELRKSYPEYFISKNKIALKDLNQVPKIFEALRSQIVDGHINTIDGIKIDFEQSWVHMRPSNTEPIIRIYAEATTQTEADELAEEFVQRIEKLV